MLPQACAFDRPEGDAHKPGKFPVFRGFCPPLFFGEELRLNKFWLCADCAIYLRAITVRESALGRVGCAAILHNANYNDNRK